MNDKTLEARILDIVGEVSPVGRANIGLDDDFSVLRLDSVGSMELVSMLCEEFDIDIDVEEAFEVRTVREAMALTQRHLDARGA